MGESTAQRIGPVARDTDSPWLDAIVLAGGDPAHDAELLRYAGGAPCKALIPVGGRSMLEHVLAALRQSGYVRRVVVVGLPAGTEVALQRLSLGPDVAWVPDSGGMLENGRSAFEYLCAHGGASERIVLSTADLPLLTPAIIRGLLDMFLSVEADFCYPIVPQALMERALPGSGRTFVPLREGRFAGGDIDLVRATVLDADRAAINEALGARKAFWRQVRMVGLDTLALFLVRRLTVARIEHRVRRVFGITGKAFICPYPEVAMDVDKPHHLDIVCAAWAHQAVGEVSSATGRP